MTAHFTALEIMEATAGRLLKGGWRDSLAGVSTDSRTCQSGELFIPLQGERHDGHEYIPKAVARGAWGVLVQESLEKRLRPGKGIPPHPGGGGFWSGRLPLTVLTVPDTLTALGDLARHWRQRFRLPVVAITGSCGKTTAKEMTARVLSRGFRVLKNELNLNNLIGLPHTLLQLNAQHEAAVVEMGMNRFGEIRRLTEISRPTVGVLLNAFPAHTEGVGDVEGVARAKGELIDGLEPGAVLVYNADDGRLASRAASFLGRKVSFGFGPEAAVRATGRQVQGNVKQTAQLSWRGQSWPLSLPVPGQHQVYNALAATAVGLALGLQPAECAAALAGFTAIPRRSQVMQLPSGVHLLNDCYNANPGSMGTALRTLVELKEAGRAAAALGDMLELGDCTAAEHRELGRLTAGLGLDLLVVYGKMREEVAAGAREGGLAAHRIYPVVRHVEGAMILKEFLQPGDWLLVKGSRSTHMENLVENLVRQE